MEPTLCFRLKTGLRLAAFLDMLISLGMVVVSVGAIYYLETQTEDVLQFIHHPPEILDHFLDLGTLSHNTVRVLLGINTLYWAQKVYLSWLSDRAAAHESSSKCKTWLIYTFLLLILSIAFFLASIIIQVLKPLSIPVYVVCFVVREYSMWIVVRFKGQLDDSKSVTARLMDAKDITSF